MKSNTLLLIALCVFLLASCTSKVKHHSYTTYYNKSKGEPDSVSWDLTPFMVGCGKGGRHERFAADPAIDDCTKPSAYRNSGYDKGHLFPFGDAECDADDRVECFYMSNMLPQMHELNAGDWEELEKQERAWAASQPIHIIAGGCGSKGSLASGVNIPASCWKAIYVAGHWRAWIMPNEASSRGHRDISYWEVTDLKQFDAITGLKLR